MRSRVAMLVSAAIATSYLDSQAVSVAMPARCLAHSSCERSSEDYNRLQHVETVAGHAVPDRSLCRGPGSGGQSAAAVFPGGLEGNRRIHPGDAGARGESETPGRTLRPWQGRHPKESSRDAEGRSVLHLAWLVPGELRDRAQGQRCVR